jgi:replicative DNA helicase
MLYQRLCETLNSVGELIPAEDNIYKHIKDQNKDYYTSIYFYNEDHKKKAEEIVEVNKNGKVSKRQRGVSGFTDVYTNKLVFDFDSDNVETSLKDTRECILRLIDKGVPKNCFEVCFSGNKGFSISVTHTTNLSPEEVKNIAINVASGLSTFDTKIYNASRIFRVPYTKHQVSGLYKTPLTYDEVFSMDSTQIKSLAVDPYEPSVFALKCTLTDKVLALKEPVKKKLELVKVGSTTVSDIDFNKKPKWLSHWKYALLNGYFPSGCRSYSLMVLAATFKAQSFPEEVTYHALKGAAEIQAGRYNVEPFSKEEIYTNIISQVYGDFWNGGTYAEDTFPEELKQYLTDLGIPRKVDKDSEDIFKDSSDVFKIFGDFAKNIDKNTLKTGIEPLDNMKDLRITTGMLVGLLGAPSVGKTAVSFQVMNNASKNNQQVAFFSMDMGAPLVFQRLIQKCTGYKSDKLFDIFKNQDMTEIEKMQDAMTTNYKNVHFSFRTAMTTQMIREGIISIEEKTGEKVKIAVVDYLECISSGISEPTAKISMISQELKDIATDLDVCVLLLLQPPKRAGDPSCEITSYNDIKGAATVAQACSVIVSLWREGFHPRTVELDNFITFAVLKNRMGSLGFVDCRWEGLTGKVSTLTDVERSELNDLRESKRSNNGGGSSGGFDL